jgi:uncharacterized protein (TIGR02246 family)
MQSILRPWTTLIPAVGVVIFALSGAHPANGAPAADLQGIDKLHSQDVAATLSGDPQALADLFTDDAVLLEPDAPAVIGRKAILDGNKKEKIEHPGGKTVKYKVDVKDTQIVGDWAFEWAYFESSYRETEKAPVQSFRGKTLRVMKRQADGSWKFARMMWNLAEDNGPPHP